MPDLHGWLVLAGIGGLGASGHYLLIHAFKLAPAARLSPFLYLQILAAAIYSVVWFDEVIDSTFLLGAGLIVGAGLIASRPLRD